MPQPTRVAVLGVGALGKEHARIYAEYAATGRVEFVGVYDVAAELAAKVASRFRVPAFASVDEAAARSDAFSVVTPTNTHFAVAKPLLEQGKHLLIEKPITNNATEASDLIETAIRNNSVLQVGSIRRSPLGRLPLMRRPTTGHMTRCACLVSMLLGCHEFAHRLNLPGSWPRTLLESWAAPLGRRSMWSG